jgi:pyrroline-5-carboxylate reductase
LGAKAVFENKLVLERSDVVIVSVKPDVVGKVLREIAGLETAVNKLYISVAMGVSTTSMEKVSAIYFEL